MSHTFTPDKNDYVEVRSVRFTFEDIFAVVSAFYRDIVHDPQLNIPFQSVEDWPHHIERLTHFWWTRFGGRAYLEGFYNPVQKHFEAGFNETLLERWLYLFRQTLDKHLTKDQAELWSSITQSMGMALSRNNELMKKNNII